MCWIYTGNRFMPLSNVDRATLLNPDNLSLMPGDEKLVSLTPPAPPQPFLSASNSSQPSSTQNYIDIHATFLSTQEEQHSSHVYVQTEHANLRDFVQE